MLVLVLALGGAGCSRSEPARTEPPAAAPAKDPQAARALIKSGAVVLDVRTPEEYAGGHLPGAVNVPVQELERRLPDVEALVGGDKARPIVVYCGSGNRDGKAKRALEAAGHSRVVNGGGLDDLQ